MEKNVNDSLLKCKIKSDKISVYRWIKHRLKSKGIILTDRQLFNLSEVLISKLDNNGFIDLTYLLNLI